ncbi:MAG: ABC transporter permease [Alphaproteobacteria bacterium]|nr:ABC transporter permease [Alphaproteobacteria bacterium]
MVDTALPVPSSKSRRRSGFRSGATAIWQDTNWIVRLTALVGLVLVFLALAAPLVSPFDPNAQSLLSRLKPPLGFDGAKPGYLLGTDELGRDILSRCLYGLRLTLGVALLGAMIGLAIGGTLGLVAGLRRGLFDDLIMGLVDIQIAVPFTLIALLAVALFGGDLHVLVAVLGIAYWEQYARITRGEVLRLREMPFIEAAQASGASTARIALRHILPNIVSPLVVAFTVNISNIVLLESTLSFLGLGLRPPTATLGSMVGMGRDFMPSAPWIVAAPALLILLLTFVIQMLGDWLRDHTDVRLRER